MDAGDRQPVLPRNAFNAFQAERRQQKWFLILKRRRIRDMCNPYDVTHESFTQAYRLSQDLTFSLINLLRPHIRRTTSPLATPIEIKILCALHFFATGSYQSPAGRNIDVAVAQPTVSGFVEEFVTALNHPNVARRLVKFPTTPEQANNCMERNRLLGGKLPNVVGYIDGSLIKIMKPPVAANRQAYVGRKSFASVNVLFTCDRRLYVMNVLARYPGATNDSFIYAQSAVRRKMIDLQRDVNCFLLGDSGFPQEPWLMAPYARQEEPEEGTPEARYNTDHCSDRNAVERVIGVLKGKWRAINDERVLHYDPVKVCRIVVAVTVLHNLCILARVPFYDDLAAMEPFEVNDYVDEYDDPEIRVLNRGRAIRQDMVQFLEIHRN